MIAEDFRSIERPYAILAQSESSEVTPQALEIFAPRFFWAWVICVILCFCSMSKFPPASSAPAPFIKQRAMAASRAAAAEFVKPEDSASWSLLHEQPGQAQVQQPAQGSTQQPAPGKAPPPMLGQSKQLELVIPRRLSPAVLEHCHLLEVISRKRHQLRSQCLRVVRRPIRRLAKCLGLHSSRPNVLLLRKPKPRRKGSDGARCLGQIPRISSSHHSFSSSGFRKTSGRFW